MKEIIILTLVVLCLAVMTGNKALKAKDNVSIGASADVMSKYVRCCQNIVDGWFYNQALTQTTTMSRHRFGVIWIRPMRTAIMENSVR